MAKVYRTKVGFAYIGGCGLNTLRRVVDKYTPQEYRNFFNFGADTDAKVRQKHFGDQEEDETEGDYTQESDQTSEQKERLKLWTDAGALTIHQLGEEITKGRGAGGIPDVGQQAANTAASIEAMTAFFESVDDLFLVGGVGGGTGTGALPVAAALAVKLKKPTLAIIIIPDPGERRTDRATKALAEIKKLVPTIAISNGYLKEMASQWTEERQEELTYPEGWQIINENSLLPMLLIIREIVQVTGDINLDQADWETLLSFGNNVFFGKADLTESEGWAKRFVKKIVSEQFPRGSAEQIVEELCAGPFQDPGIIEQGEVIALWAHGPWPMKKTDRILELIGERVAGKRDKKPEVFFGIVNKVSDNKMWIALLVVAKQQVNVAETVAYEVPNKREGVKRLSDWESPAIEVPDDRVAAIHQSDARSPNFRPAKPVVSMISFRHGNGYKECKVQPDLAKRFEAYRNDSTTREEMERLFDEVERATEFRPEMPERFAPKEEEKKTLWGRLASS